MQRADERLVAGERRGPLRDVVRDLLLRERIEHDLLAQAVQAQLVPHRLERMVVRDDLGETKVREPHQAGVSAPARDVVDELDRRRSLQCRSSVTSNSGRALGVAIEELAHLAQHPVRADARELASQGVALLRGAEPRQLQQPGGRHGAQQRRDRAVAAAQLRERFEDRQVRLACTVLLDALAAGAGDLAEARNEVFDQRRLADTGSPATQTTVRFPVHASSQARFQPRKRVRPADE